MLRLKAERLKRGLSQTRLAAMAGIHPATLSRIETGRMYPYPGWRKRLAEALGWPVERADELFEEVSEDETHS
jgi:transcriptional regulator with XRE-family HTH domain